MTKKPTADAYTAQSLELVRATTLYIATKLGDLLDDVVIVGGLVPTLLIPQEQSGPRSHVGTLDVDLGLAIGILDKQRYHEVCHRLRSAGFHPDKNDQGNETSQRWKIETGRGTVTVDFLIPPSQEGDNAGTLRNLEQGFAAIITQGLELAFQDRETVSLEGTTILGERAQRRVGVCGAGAFIVLKAIAFRNRGENKDAYDLVYVLQNYGRGVADVFAKLQPLLTDAAAQQAIDILREDFTEVDSLGPTRVAAFFGDPNNDAIRADAAAAVRRLLTLCNQAT